ncbi:MAG: IS481 family transposase [Thermomicrobiales bacterium]
MPWKETSAMSLRQEVITRAGQGDPIAALARTYGISRKTIYKWLQRAGDADGLGDRSRRPRTSPRQTDPAIAAQVLALRREHPTWGGRKLHHRLRALGVAAPPAPSTITALLHRQGLIRPDPPTAAVTRFEADAANDLWQLDFKGWHPSRTGRIYPLTLADDHSRFLFPITCLPDQRGAPVQAALTAIFQRYGLPWVLLCDNGKPWGASGSGGLTKLEVWCIQLGIRMIHGRPYHPQTQGKLERMHRTLKAEVFGPVPYATLGEAQAACDRFRDVYNLERPHEMLDYATPISRYTASPRAFPPTLPLPTYADDVLVRRVSAKGAISFKNQRHAIGEGLAGHDIGIRPSPGQDGRFDILFHHQVVRVIDLNHPLAEEGTMCYPCP